MEGLEILAVIVFFLIGYWLVDHFWPKKKDEQGNPQNKS